MLGRLRDGELHLNAERTTALLSLVDVVREMLDNIETQGQEGDGDYSSLIETLTQLLEADEAETSEATSAPTVPSEEGEIEETEELADTEPSLDQVEPSEIPRSGEAAQLQADAEAETHQIEAQLEKFLVESYENLDGLDQVLMTLEADTSNPEIPSRISGTIETLKDSCGSFGFTTCKATTHAGENLLSWLRDGERPRRKRPFLTSQSNTRKPANGIVP